MKYVTRFSLVKWHFRDYFIFRNRKVIAYILALLSEFFWIVRLEKFGYKILLLADRLGCLTYTRKIIKKRLKRIIELSRVSIEPPSIDDIEWIKKRCIVIKSPKHHNNTIEKGVLIINFSTTFHCVLNSLDCKRLCENYIVVLEPSWAGYALPEIFLWLDFGEKVFIQSSEIKDRELIQSLEHNLIDVSFGASDWVDDTIFYPIKGVEKSYDLIFVANYNSIKRHYSLLNALKEIIKEQSTFKAVFVMGPWGDSKDQINDLIRDYNLSENIDFFENIPQQEVNLLLNKSKVNILLTLKEGSNRSLFEGMFANVPAIVLEENIGVNKDYFNTHTGQVVKEKDLVNAIIHFSTHWNKYSPRGWVMDNISPVKTTLKLEKSIKNNGFICNDHLKVKFNKPEAEFRDKLDINSIDEVINNFTLSL